MWVKCREIKELGGIWAACRALGGIGELGNGTFKFAISFQVRGQKYRISRTYEFSHFVFGECERGVAWLGGWEQLVGKGLVRIIRGVAVNNPQNI